MLNWINFELESEKIDELNEDCAAFIVGEGWSDTAEMGREEVIVWA